MNDRSHASRRLVTDFTLVHYRVGSSEESGSEKGMSIGARHADDEKDWGLTSRLA